MKNFKYFLSKNFKDLIRNLGKILLKSFQNLVEISQELFMSKILRIKTFSIKFRLEKGQEACQSSNFMKKMT